MNMNTDLTGSQKSGATAAVAISELAQREMAVMHAFNRLFEEQTNASEAAHAWRARFDDTDIDTATREEFVVLMETAPTEAIFTYLVGKFHMRLAIAGVTGRAFL